LLLFDQAKSKEKKELSEAKRKITTKKMSEQSEDKPIFACEEPTITN
jgi:hypothetical protein